MPGYKGKYRVKNLDKYIGDPNNVIFRSLWERKFMVRCDTDPSIIKWGSESFPIPYLNEADNRIHRYFIDFFIKIKDKDGNIRKIAIEIKPYAQTIPPVKKRNSARYIQEMITYTVNTSKWKAARLWAQENGFEFLIMTEKQLGIS